MIQPYVLLPGSFLGGWSWQRIVPLLRESGHEVFTPSFTGLGDRAHLAGAVEGLVTHVADLRRVLEAEDLRDAIVVAHSYAGAVMSALDDHARRRVSQYVYLDACLPEAGWSLLDLADEAFAERYRSTAVGGYVPLPAGTTERWAIPAAADRAWVERLATPHPLSTLTDPAPRAVPDDVHRAYLYCTVKPGLDVFGELAQRVRDDPGWSFYELATGHVPQIENPVELAAVLGRARAAAGLG